MRTYLLQSITVIVAGIFLYRLLDLQVLNTNYQTNIEHKKEIWLQGFQQHQKQDHSLYLN